MSKLPDSLSNLRVIRDNQRYSTYKAEYHDAPVFAKLVKAPALRAGIRREIWGIQAFRQLADAKDLGFAIPEMIASGDDYVVTSWAEGQPIDFSPESADFDDHIQFFATSLAQIDMLAYMATPQPGEPDTAPKDIRSRIDTLKSRLETTAYGDYFDQTLIEKGFEYLYQNTGTLTTRFTHADFTPGNVLEHDGRRTLVDYESVSSSWPRFYDVVNLTINRIVSQPELVPGCLQIIERYFSVNTATSLVFAMPQMNVIAMLRSLSLIWEHLTEPNDHHNTQAAMTNQVRDRLIASIEQILAGKSYFEAFE
mgnify:FL=1